MKIGIISDTHDQLERIKKAVQRFNKEKVSLVYLLGDICSPFSVQPYKDLKCSVKAVFGNNDADIYKHLKWKPDNMEFFDKSYVDEQDGKKILLIHGDPESLVESLLASQHYDVVMAGHTHKAEIRKTNKTLLINPGSLVGPFGKWKDWTKPSISIYDTNSNSARIVRI